MDYKKSNQLTSFLFILAGIGAVMFGFLYFGKGIFNKTNHYHVFFKQVQGLSSGSFVSLSGFRIGYVKSINLAAENKIDVLISVESDYGPKITQGCIADIKTQGALGDKYIYIEPSVTESEVIADNGTIRVSESPDFLDMITKNGTGVGQVMDVVTDVHKITSQLGADQKLSRVVDNLIVITENLKKTSEDSQKIMATLKDGTAEQMKDSVIRLNSILRKVDQGQGTLGALINDSSLHDQLKNILGVSSSKKDYKNLIRMSIDEKSK